MTRYNLWWRGNRLDPAEKMQELRPGGWRYFAAKVAAKRQNLPMPASADGWAVWDTPQAAGAFVSVASRVFGYPEGEYEVRPEGELFGSPISCAACRQAKTCTKVVPDLGWICFVEESGPAACWAEGE